jgi:ribosome-associated translation inhibitor RaiA
MQVPLDITFENSEPSEAIRSEVEKQAKRLEKFHDRITSCNVAVIAPQTRHRKGDLFKIDIRIAMPEHKDILVTKTHGDAPEHEHIAVAIKDAFGAAQRQIEDAVREMRGQVKPHEAEDHGRVSKFVAGDDYGFIETWPSTDNSNYDYESPAVSEIADTVARMNVRMRVAPTMTNRH